MNEMRWGFSTSEAYFTILAVLVVLTAIGTFIGQWLSSKSTTDLAINRNRIINSRIRAAWGLIFVFAVAVYLGQGALVFIFAIASFFSLREFIALTPTRRHDHSILILAFYVAIPVQYILVWLNYYNLFTLFIPVYLFLALPVVMVLSKDTDRFLERVAKVQWGIMLCIFCVSHAPAIASIDLQRYHSSGLFVLLYFLMVLYFADLFQILVSAIFGGRPSFSNPNKTYKGIILGSIGALAIGSALFWMTPFRAWQAPLMSLLIIVSGTLGGLVMSSVKRSLGAKRLDNTMLLTRGTLDRLEMLFFAAPVYYHALLLFFN